MPGAERALGQDEVALHEPARLGIDDARHLHPIDQGDHQRDDPQAGPQQRRQNDREQKRREGHHQIGEAHQRIPDKPAHIAGHDADDHSDHRPRRRWRRGR